MFVAFEERLCFDLNLFQPSSLLKWLPYVGLLMKWYYLGWTKDELKITWNDFTLSYEWRKFKKLIEQNVWKKSLPKIQISNDISGLRKLFDKVENGVKWIFISAINKWKIVIWFETCNCAPIWFWCMFIVPNVISVKGNTIFLFVWKMKELIQL